MSPRNSSPLTLRVCAIRQVTPAVKSFELVSANNDPLPPFDAGAHIEVAVAGTMPRSYSLLNDPVERDRYVVAVLLESSGGGGSVWMHNVLREGDNLTCLPPRNTFSLNEGAGEHILIAGGIGITPILSMVYRLRHLEARFSLHYCTRAEALTAFRSELAEMLDDDVSFYHDGGDPARGLDLQRLLRERPPDADVYVCGPRLMIDATRQAARGWPSEAVHFELFSSGNSAGTTSPPEGDESFVVELARSKRILTIPPHKSILAILAENGFVLPSVCKEGWCGTCRVRVLAGRIDHRDDILDDEIKANHTAMQICVSRAARGERLVLDL